ncbi:Putative K(+)-stimulated pyrophosphate-energized sodium pump [Rubripirellula lacrimiformis]|uniref:Putative K(+)-stimulated pyrophosphate-energized sodium pump n=1 Tax=Rubripirellula lacrimiformis TaxID=1930273 RepID=A0A517N6U1_9BACT|nr:sodium-translocating pyrophosphatase [Rubripirellula lacrimiformis]QDT02718.1 Putative K(+)-stimulated pyrophosphate-energized sodium pump [Rubripirellula lacrimiformis]
MFAFSVWCFATASSIAGLAWAWRFYAEMMRADEGNDAMREIAESVRSGADAYLRQQFKWVAIVFGVVALLLAIASFGLRVQHEFAAVAFLSGGLFSGLCGWFGMKTATRASSRTAAAAQHSLNDGLQIAFRSGAVMGLTVVGMGLLYVCGWFAIMYWGIPMVAGQDAAMNLQQISVAMLSFGMGASVQALFARVGGGIFTKAADVGADLVGKVEQSLKEDSPRNPATIADNVGDNVGDVAGMGADLYESYCGSILAASALGVAAFRSSELLPAGTDTTTAQLHAMLLPIAIAATGILLSIVGIYAVKTGEELSQKSLLKALAKGINLSAVLVSVAAVAVTWALMPAVPGTLVLGVVPGISVSIVVGLVAGWAIGQWTERVTSDEYATTQNLAKQAETGPATLIISGVADGMLSTWAPVVIVCTAMLLAFGFANGGDFSDSTRFSLGLYGIGIAAVGMLSTLGITLATDAYGPIADNAGGNASMAGLPDVVRDRTDALDSLGNTTAATGKGFAIGSAALTALALLAAYVESVRDGFQRWGDDHVVSEQLGDGYHMINDTLAVQRTGDQNDVFLLMPSYSTNFAPQPVPASLDTSEQNDSNDPAALAATRPAAVQPVADAVAPSVAGRRVPLLKADLHDFLVYYDATLMNPRVLIGVFLGAMSTFVFCAMTMKSVGRAAQGMVIEVRRQFSENPGILDGTVKPDYQRPVAISTQAAQREMILPSLLGLWLPIATGLVLGVGGVIGLLTGCLTSGFCLAVFMANSGGAWDNAKKHIEAGNYGGKNSEAHKAAVVGDTVGDPFKDTSGPSLNILIKLMSMVSVVVAGLVVRYSLVAIGWF